MSATRDEVREAVAAEIYETFPRIQAPESPAPKWSDCKTRYRREWYRCADAAIAAMLAAAPKVAP